MTRHARLALTATLLLGLAPALPALAHPAPYPHRHYVRPVQPEPRPVARRPRRAVEPALARPRVWFGFGGFGNSISATTFDADTLESGGGFELFFGGRFNPWVGGELGWMSSFHTATLDAPDYTRGVMNAITGDVKLFLTPRPVRIEPYLQAGVGVYILNRDTFFGQTLTGPGFQLGGGLNILLNRSVSIGGRVLYRGAFVEDREAEFFGDPPESAFFNMVTFGGNLALNF